MANYYANTRTNDFRVKNPDEFKKYMSEKVVADEDVVHIWEETSKDGTQMFGFGCYGSIIGEKIEPETPAEDEDVDYSYDDFCNSLAEFVEDDDAIIITEIGNEKLRYLTGYATIITKRETTGIDLSQMAAQKASEILGNPSWKTKMYY